MIPFETIPSIEILINWHEMNKLTDEDIQREMKNAYLAGTPNAFTALELLTYVQAKRRSYYEVVTL